MTRSELAGRMRALALEAGAAGLDGEAVYLEQGARLAEQNGLVVLGRQVCNVCGCTDELGCPEGCYWIAPSLCSRCAAPA
jgi:hypothetical protein